MHTKKQSTKQANGRERQQQNHHHETCLHASFCQSGLDSFTRVESISSERWTHVPTPHLLARLSWTEPPPTVTTTAKGKQQSVARESAARTHQPVERPLEESPPDGVQLRHKKVVCDLKRNLREAGKPHDPIPLGNVQAVAKPPRAPVLLKRTDQRVRVQTAICHREAIRVHDCLRHG